MERLDQGDGNKAGNVTCLVTDGLYERWLAASDKFLRIFRKRCCRV